MMLGSLIQDGRGGSTPRGRGAPAPPGSAGHSSEHAADGCAAGGPPSGPHSHSAPDSGSLSGGGASGQLPEHLFRLFVGWVPKGYSEADLRPLFDQWGDVRDIITLKDKVSGEPRGCAFVSYGTREEADAAIAHLDRRVTLPGAPSPLEVRFARSHQYVQAGAGPQDNRQLFFARAPPGASESDLRALFSRYGHVEEINLFRQRSTHQSKGCGFVTMAARPQAVAVMAALDERHVMDGADTPLAIKWADPELQVKKRRAVEDSSMEKRMLFFAKVLRTASEDDVRGLFSRYGRVFELNIFRAFQGAPTTKGCGLVTLGSAAEALAAIEALDGQYTWDGMDGPMALDGQYTWDGMDGPMALAAIEALDGQYTWDGMDGPMIVKWMDAALQRRRREEHLASMRHGGPAPPAGPAPGAPTRRDVRSAPHAAPPVLAALGAAGARGRSGGGGGGGGPGAGAGGGGLGSGGGGGGSGGGHHFSSGSSGGYAFDVAPQPIFGSELPPTGCAPDAYKLFIGNVPKSYTEESLRPIFEAAGTVAELIVVRDKFSHESKGSAFVWYRTRADADRAAALLNARHALPDASGAEPARPLVVRRANTRRPAAAFSAPGGLAGPPGGGGGGGRARSSSGGGGGGAAFDLRALGLGGGGGGYAVEYVQLPPGGGPPPSYALLAPPPPPPHGGGAPPPGGPQPMVFHAVTSGGGGGAGQQLFVPAGEGYALFVAGPPPGGGGGASGSGAAAFSPSSTLHSSGAPPGAPPPGGASGGSGPLSGGGGGGDDEGGLLTMTLPLVAGQMAAIQDHIFSIQTMSGAGVSSQAVAPGVFCLVLRGLKFQIETANQLIATVLQNSGA
ncbi:MAG: hypothetical protein J3K34DRAFT_487277 [Monoraphidium minutum]|nr:MAG: hypothetical protein J3K34DRAFT_487277 [Monoraphidium minutum]